MNKMEKSHYQSDADRFDRLYAQYDEAPFLYADVNDGILEERQKQSLFHKLGRKVLDFLKISTPTLEQERDAEMLPHVIAAYDAIENAHEAINVTRKNISKINSATTARLEALAEKEKEEKGRREAFDYTLSKASSAKTEMFRRQRAQEIVEREISSRLLTVDKLEEEALAGDSGVSVRSIPYGDDDVKVYDLRGFPYALLTTAIDFKVYKPSILEEGVAGIETARAVIKNPALWAQRRDEVEKSGSMRKIGPNVSLTDARGTTIHASYSDSGKLHNGRSGNSGGRVPLTYGFSKVTGDRIIGIYSNDGGTSNMEGDDMTHISDPATFMGRLDNLAPGAKYNEITMRRYSENGMPMLPDYIVAEDGIITEAMLKHAAYFGIPIVNIENKYYDYYKDPAAA